VRRRVAASSYRAVFHLDLGNGARAIRIVGAPGIHPIDPYAGEFAARMRIPRAARVLDLGCGAGTYALAAAALGAGRVVATDIDPRAVACTLANARRGGFGDAVEGRAGSLFAPVYGERFDVAVATLPQLPAPRPVIPTRYGGPDGLRLLGRLAARIRDHLVPGGRLYALVTDWAGPDTFSSLLRARGLAVREVARVERAFQPVEYDRLAPGLFAYLDGHVRSGRGRLYRRAGAWCYLGVTFLEATSGQERLG